MHKDDAGRQQYAPPRNKLAIQLALVAMLAHDLTHDRSSAGRRRHVPSRVRSGAG